MGYKIKKGSACIPVAFALRFATADANMLQLLSLSAHHEDDAANIQQKPFTATFLLKNLKNSHFTRLFLRFLIFLTDFLFLQFVSTQTELL